MAASLNQKCSQEKYETSPSQSICVLVRAERVDLVAENIIGASRALAVVVVLRWDDGDLGMLVEHLAAEDTNGDATWRRKASALAECSSVSRLAPT